ncbi:MAG: ArnT family glycosyltransferase [Coriobacteriia bacterium]
MTYDVLAWTAQRRRRGLAMLALLFALSFGARAAYNLLFVGSSYEPVADALDYHTIAVHLAQGGGYRLGDGTLTASRPPLFPLVLAGSYRLFGVSYTVGLLLEAFIGAAVALAVYWLGKLAFGIGTGLFAGLVAATYPLLIFAGSSLLTEPLFVLLVTMSAAAALRALRLETAGSYLFSGALIGLACLTRPNGMLLLPAVLVWLLLAHRGAWRRRLRDGLLVTIAACAIVSPWVVRNAIVFGQLIPSTTMGGTVLLGAYNDRILSDASLHGGWISPCETNEFSWSCHLDEVSRDRVQTSLALEFIATHPADLPRMVWWRFVTFWHLYPFTRGFPANVGFYYYVVVAILALPGFWLARRSWRSAGVIWAVIACFMASGIAFWADFRMRAPAEPALIVMASVTVATVLERLTRRNAQG